MPPRSIVHLDADAFFASVEQAADSRLRGKPIAVGGQSRGIIAPASYEARKFGIYTPMPTSRARKLCPKLIVLSGDYDRYEEFSNWMFGYPFTIPSINPDCLWRRNLEFFHSVSVFFKSRKSEAIKPRGKICGGGIGEVESTVNAGRGSAQIYPGAGGKIGIGLHLIDEVGGAESVQLEIAVTELIDAGDR